MYRLLASMAVFLVLSVGFATASDTPPSSEPPVPAVKVKLKAYDAQQRLAYSQTFELHGSQMGFASFAHSPLKLAGPTSPDAAPLTDDSAHSIATNGEPVVIFPCDFSLFVKTAVGANQSLGWDEPSQQLLCATFPDGTRGVLRLPEDYTLSQATLTVGDQTVQLQPFSPVEYAALQLSGEPATDADSQRAEWSVPNWVAAADARSLVASASGQGQAEALQFAGKAVTHMLDEYKKQHQAYPATLDQLWQGSNAVAPISPGNPYAWGTPLCLPAPPPDGQSGLFYVPLRSTDLPQSAPSGYLLGVQDSSRPALPPTGLPFADKLPPAVKWFYQPAAALDKTAVVLSTQPASKVKLKVFDLKGQVLMCQTFDMRGGWFQFASYAPEHGSLHYVLSQDAGAAPQVCADKHCLEANGEPVVIAPLDFTLLARRNAATAQTTWWDHPSGQFYSATFKDGSRAMLRVPEGSSIDHGTITLDGEEVPIMPDSPLVYAGLQALGTPSPVDSDPAYPWPAAQWIAAADCRSLLASASGQGQAEALQFAGQAVTHMLDEYKKQHQAYPATLDQLWQGSTAVAPISPANPYAWGTPLCTATAPTTGHGLVYVPLHLAGNPLLAINGYALGVVDQGAAAPAPSGVRLPVDLPTVVKWTVVPVK